MNIIFKFFRDEILEAYFGITDPIMIGIISIAVILGSILLIIFLIKTIIEIKKMKKERRDSSRRIDKLWLDVLRGKDKNKEHKNY